MKIVELLKLTINPMGIGIWDALAGPFRRDLFYTTNIGRTKNPFFFVFLRLRFDI